LYSFRWNIIKWYSANYPSLFAYYGNNWDKTIFHGGPLCSVINKLEIPAHYTNRLFNTYNGTPNVKDMILRKTKFTFAFENARNYRGYLTEKIFDAMKCGAVPIYLGATDILELIPRNCFIHMADFTSLSELNDYLLNVTEDEYMILQKHIQEFNRSEKAKFYKPSYFVANIFDNITKQKRI